MSVKTLIRMLWPDVSRVRSGKHTQVHRVGAIRLGWHGRWRCLGRKSFLHPQNRSAINGFRCGALLECAAGKWTFRRALHGPGESVTVGEVLRLLAQDGWYRVATRGSHRQFKHPWRPGRVTVAAKPGERLARGTLRSILKQAGLN
jgi:predicted RNA binding protein YcfA (HicA-like mRNA interferase family)